MDTRWASELFFDPQWIAVDWGRTTTISHLALVWEEPAFGKIYEVQVAQTEQPPAEGEWETVFTAQFETGGWHPIDLPPTSTRWLRIFGRERGGIGGKLFGYSLFELRVYPTAP